MPSKGALVDQCPLTPSSCDTASGLLSAVLMMLVCDITDPSTFCMAFVDLLENLSSPDGKSSKECYQ